MNALIIIDMQYAYFKTPNLVRSKDRLVGRINSLIHDATLNGDLLINVKTIHSPDKQTWTLNMLEDDKGFAFEGSSEVRNVAGLNIEKTVECIKTRDSAFHETGLWQLLQDNKVTSVTLAGVSTHSCIFHTASQAYAYNIPTTIVASAVGDEDETLAQQSLEYLQREYRQQII